MTYSIRTILAIAATGASLMLATTNAQAVDAEAALQLARANNCLKCHSVTKDKDGPAYHKVAEKYKGKPKAQARLIEHIN